MTKPKLTNLIKLRVSKIAIHASPLPQDYRIGVVEWFGREMRDKLHGLHFDGNENPTESGSSRVEIRPRIRNTPAKLLLSDSMVSMFVNLSNECHLAPDELSLVIDNFIIHEIVHRCQGMGDLNHRGLSTLAPNVLHECDYQADASAVLIQYWLAAIERRLNGSSCTEAELWNLYTNLIQSVIWQMHLFMLTDDQQTLLNAEQVLDKTISFTRWERLCIWHFQYHRSVMFNKGRSIGDFQIMFRPAIGFRNQYFASNKYLTSRWPERERADFGTGPAPPTRDVPAIALSSINRWGIRRFVYFTPGALDQLSSLFKGVFSANCEESEKFFRPALASYPYLVGDEWYGSSPDDPDGAGKDTEDSNIIDFEEAVRALAPSGHAGVVAKRLYQEGLAAALHAFERPANSGPDYWKDRDV